MKILQSKSGNNYEFDPSAKPISENGYWSCFDGFRLLDIMSMPVVIYFIRPGDEEITENLLAWLKSIPKSVFNHPNIICPTDYVEETDYASNVRGAIKNLYIIFLANEGVSLSGLMQGQTNGKPLESSTPMCELYKNDRIHFAKTITIETLKILEHLHNLGISIGCINPDFILLTNDNKIKIDFIETFYWHQVKQAVTYNQGLNPQATVIAFCGIISGKYNEMVAPELLYGCTDARVDLYSTGILLFYLITGHLPFNGNSDIMMSLNRDVPLHEIEDEQLRRIIKKATEKNPAKRYQSTREFIVDLDKIEEVQIPWYWKIYRFFHKDKGLLCILLSALFALFFCPYSNAQNTMRINYKDGSIYDAPIERIDSVTFIEETSDRPHEASLVGEWFWGNKEKGYYEILTLNEDRTYAGYDYYLDYGFDTMTYGTYMSNGIMLNLWSNGYGYRRTYRWFVTALTENALEVMTQMGSFTYYRVQQEVFSLRVGEESYACNGQDYYVFTDGARVTDIDGKLRGISEGTTYVLKYNAASGLVKAYKVIVKQ